MKHLKPYNEKIEIHHLSSDEKELFQNIKDCLVDMEDLGGKVSSEILSDYERNDSEDEEEFFTGIRFTIGFENLPLFFGKEGNAYSNKELDVTGFFSKRDEKIELFNTIYEAYKTSCLTIESMCKENDSSIGELGYYMDGNNNTKFIITIKINY